MSPLRYIAMPPVGVACLLFIALTPAANGRTWTNTDGQKLEAEFVRLSNRAAVLQAGERTINAPLKRLSEEDNAWIDRYKKLMRSREWGKLEGAQSEGADSEGVQSQGARYEGRFDEVKNGKVRVRRGSTIEFVPYEELSDDDWRYLAKVLTHREQEMPEDLLALKPPPELTLNDGIAPADAVERSWTDVTGREIVAGYLGVQKSYALLWMRDKEFKVPLARLSPDDRRWIASQSVSELTGSLQLAMAAVSQVTMKAQSQGPPPPEVLEVLQPPAAVQEAEPESPPPQQSPKDDPAISPAVPGRVEHIDEIDEWQYDAMVVAAFGEDYEEAGIAECIGCEAGFEYPKSFHEGDACPFCGVAVTELITNAELEEMTAELITALGGESRPWYMSRWVRRLVITVVIAGIGLGVKIATGGD